MKKIWIKCLLLAALLICLLSLVIYHPINTFEKVKIIEKYYSSKPGEKMMGSKTKKKLSIPTDSKTESCAMEFDNGKILMMDCHTFLNYSIGETVKIKYSNDKLIEIRRK